MQANNKMVGETAKYEQFDKDPFEKNRRTSICKSLYMEIHKKSSNIATKGELGRYPMIIYILKPSITRKTAGTAENPAAHKYPHVKSKFAVILTLHTYNIDRTVITPPRVLLGKLEVFLLSLNTRPKF